MTFRGSDPKADSVIIKQCQTRNWAAPMTTSDDRTLITANELATPNFAGMFLTAALSMCKNSTCRTVF